MKNKGITLVALVITIIILLILVGITINSLTENGLFGKAKQSKENYTKARAEEDIKLVLNEWKIEKTSSNKKFTGFLDSKVESKEIDDYQVLENGNIEIYRNEYYLTVDYDGNIIDKIQKAVPRPIISNIKVTLENGTEPEEHSQEIGIPLIINFDTTLENGELISIEPNLPYKTTGTEMEKKFVITWKVDNNSYTKEVAINLTNKYKLKEPEITPSTTEWTNQNIMIDVDYGNIDSTYKKEISIDGGETYNLYTGPVEIEHNTVVKARITGKVEVESELEILKIDKLKPNDFTPIIVDNESSTELYIGANTTDPEATTEYGQSGIKEYQFYVYKDNTQICTSGKITEKVWMATGLTAGETYDIYGEVYDNAGNMIKSENFNYEKLEVFIWEKWGANEELVYKYSELLDGNRVFRIKSEMVGKYGWGILDLNNVESRGIGIWKTEQPVFIGGSITSTLKGYIFLVDISAASGVLKVSDSSEEAKKGSGNYAMKVGDYKGYDSVYNYYEFEAKTYRTYNAVEYVKSEDYYGIVKSNSPDSYEENGYQDGYWYVKQ